MSNPIDMIAPAHRTEDAAEFGELLMDACGVDADDNESGYWWDCPIPPRSEWASEADALAAHIATL